MPGTISRETYTSYGERFTRTGVPMTALLTPPVLTPTKRMLTAADLAVLPARLPSGPVHYELDNGSLVILAPPGDIHGAVESNLDTELKVQGEKRGLGKVRCGEVGIILRRDPD